MQDFVNDEDSVSVLQSILSCQNHNVCSALAMYVGKYAYTEMYNSTRFYRAFCARMNLKAS